MHLHGQPIPYIAYAALICVGIGYLGLLVKVVLLDSQDTGSLLVFALHTVGMFGLLLRYYGGSLKVTTTSAEAK